MGEAKSRPRDEFDNPHLWQPISCPVCKSCFQDLTHFRRSGQVRCYSGGPFTGYVRVP